MKFVLLSGSEGLDKCVFVTTKVLGLSTDGLLWYWFCQARSLMAIVMIVLNYKGFQLSAKFCKMERLSTFSPFRFSFYFF